jgi:hypothetical protein
MNDCTFELIREDLGDVMLQFAEFFNDNDLALLLSRAMGAAPCCGLGCSTAFQINLHGGGPLMISCRHSSRSLLQVVASPELLRVLELEIVLWWWRR